MQYFVTGATGFIGKRLVQALLARKGAKVFFLIRKESEGKVAGLLDYWGLKGAARSRAGLAQGGRGREAAWRAATGARGGPRRGAAAG